MNEKAKGVLAIFVFLFLFLVMNPSWLGTTTASISGTEWVGNWWLGLGHIAQTMIVLVFLIMIIAIVVSRSE